MTTIEGRDWRMLHGDCLDVMPSLERVDVVCTDPPYSEHVHGKSRRGANLPDTAEFSCRFNRVHEFGFDAIRPWQIGLAAGYFAQLVRRWVVVFSDVELAPVWRSKLTKATLEHVRTGAWWKVGGTPQFTGDRPAVAFEALNIAHPKGRKRWNGGGHGASWDYPEDDPGDTFGTVFKHLIESNRCGQRGVRVHTAQKPLSLMLDLVEQFTDPGELVLDPYCGSATTGVACLRRGRRFVGIEKDARWFGFAVERLRAEEAGSTLQAARAGQVALFGD